MALVSPATRLADLAAYLLDDVAIAPFPGSFTLLVDRQTVSWLITQMLYLHFQPCDFPVELLIVLGELRAPKLDLTHGHLLFFDHACQMLCRELFDYHLKTLRLSVVIGRLDGTSSAQRVNRCGLSRSKRASRTAPVKSAKSLVRNLNTALWMFMIHFPPDQTEFSKCQYMPGVQNLIGTSCTDDFVFISIDSSFNAHTSMMITIGWVNVYVHG